MKIVLLIFCFILSILCAVSMARYIGYKIFYINICKTVYDMKLSNVKKIEKIKEYIRNIN